MLEVILFVVMVATFYVYWDVIKEKVLEWVSKI